MKKALLLLVLFASLAFADIGPEPEHPAIFVYLQKNGIAYAPMEFITYHCDGSNSTDTGSVSQRVLNMPCIAGVCNNDVWFYKFNPCYQSNGFFSYQYEGKYKETRMLDFNDAGTYSVTIDVETGITQVQHAEPKPSPPLGCLPLFLLPLLARTVIRVRK